MANRINTGTGKFISALSAAVFLFVQFFYWLPAIDGKVYAATITVTSQADWQGGRYEFNQIDSISSAGDIKLQADLGTWDGENSPGQPDHYLAAGGSTIANTKILKIGKFVYAFRNRQTGAFLRYDLDTREWKEMAYVPVQSYEVLDATTNSIDTIWAFATRNGRKHFLKYDIPSNTWTFLDNTPLALAQGATLEYVSGTTNYIYAFQGGGTGFWRYNIALNSWSSQLTTTATCNTYCDMQYDGSRYLYLASNNYNPDRFLKIDTTATNPTWSAVANFPLDTSVNYGSDLVMVANGDFYMMRTGTAYPGTQTMYKFSGGAWSAVKDVPFTGAYGSMTYDAENNRIIVMGGIGEMAFYYPGTDTWSNTTTGPPANSYATGTTLASDGNGLIYMCRGQSLQTCYKYNTATNVWDTTMPVSPATLGATGTSLVYGNNLLYVLRGALGNSIYTYTPGSPGSWGTLAPTGAITLGDGGAAVASGSAAIFTLTGAGGTAFSRYDIAGNSFAAKTAIPEAAYRGSGLVQGTDSSTSLKYVYALVGGNRGKFYRYHETTNGWYELASLPVGSYYGGGLAYDGNNYIYAVAGGENEVWGRRLYRYNIPTNTWQRMADLPGMMRYGGGITYYNGKIYAYQGYGGSMWKYTPPTTTYKTTGNWFSPVYDNTYVSAWNSFNVSDSGSGVTYYTRTSANNFSWEDWQQVSGTTINSSVNRYLQVKVELAGDGTATPTVSSIGVDYTGDASAPVDSPIVITAKASKTSNVSLSPGTPYVYTNPYFTWSGFSETETAISGYYVYWGTLDADPVIDGIFQTSNSFVVDTPMTNGVTYKLRISAKNTAGEISAGQTYFTYAYTGISPSNSVVVADAQDQWDDVGAAKSSVYTGDSSWWNRRYSYRQQLTITAAANLQPGTIVKTTIDTAQLESQSKVRVDRNDWRIVYWDGTYWKDLGRQYVDTLNTYFPLQKGINNGASDNNYYAYYGYSGEISIPESLLENSYGNAKWGDGLSFDGNDQVQLPAGYTSAFNGKSAITIEGWFNYNNDAAAARWIYGRSAANNTSIGVTNNGHYLTYNVTTTTTTYNNTGTTFIESGKWHHFALTYDASTGTARGFVNGRLDYVRVGMTGNISAAATQMIGNYAGTYYYGFIDEMRISSVVRYSANFTPSTQPFATDANTIALYHFDDVSGQTLTDSSGNNYGGTLGSAVGADANDPTWMYGGAASAAAAENVPASPANNNLTLEPLPEGSWAGNKLTSLPWGARASYPAAAVVGNELFVLRGANAVGFFKQDLTTGIWTQLADVPAAANNGATMVYDGTGNLYITRGNNTPDIYKYTIATNTWANNIDQPAYNFTTGAIMTKIGSKLYVMPGNGAVTFLSFDTTYESTSDGIDAWSTLQSAPYGASYGSGLVFDGNNTIWLVAGNGPGFAKYSISADTWDTTVSAPALIPYPVYYSSHNAFLYNGYIYTFTSADLQAPGDVKNYIWRYSIANDKWENVQTAPEFWMYTGAVAWDGSRYAYLINGYGGSNGGNTAITRYDVLSNSYFPDVPILPIDKNFQSDSELIYHQAYTGSDLVYDGNDTLYFLQGTTQTTPANNYFDKYSISTKRWSTLPNPPCYNAGGLAFAQNKLYLVCAANTAKFYSYDPVVNEWTMLADAPGTINGGGQIIAYDGSTSLYVVRGNNSQTLYKYDIGGSWSTESNTIPAAIATGFGTTIVSDGSNYLYIARGNGTSDYYRYKYTATKGWTTLTSVPETVSNGSGAVLHNGKIYLTTAYRNSAMYIYDIGTGSWQKAPNTPSPIYAGGAMTKGKGNTLYVMQGDYFFTMWKYNLPSATSSFKNYGTYTSRPVDLTVPYAFVGLAASVSSPSGTLIKFETRTSSDNSTWDDWQEATDLKQAAGNQFIYHINSEVKRYFQARVSMTSEENMASPTVSDIAIVYHTDTVPPTNPSTVTGYETATKAATLANNTWYNKASPHFEWTGANDGTGSGVAGYRVYFGPDEAHEVTADDTLVTQASYTASLTTDGEYFLKVKAVDYAGNLAADTWGPFHYRYDGTAPNDIGTILVDPRMYSDNNSFNFSWSGTQDKTVNATSSGLLGYYYQATSSAQIHLDTFTTGTGVTGIQAYLEGVNSFFVKARDIAGNETSYKSASFYYNVTPPSVPTNLQVVTTEAAANKFAFTWDAPEVIKGNVKEYRYAINPLNNQPTAANTSAVTATLITNQKGTKSGTNKFFVVAVDEAGNVDYNNYAEIDFDVNIEAPGIPLNPESFDNSIRNTKAYRVGLTWDKPEDMGSAFDRYEIYASDAAGDCATDMTGFSLVGTTAGTSDGGSYVVTAINGEKLDSAKYYFCVAACSSSNQCSGPSTTVSMTPTGRWLVAPELIASPSATVKTKSATITWSTGRTSNSFIKYGTKSGDYTTEVGSSDQVASHTISLTGLNPGTTYYYKAIWTDEDGNGGSSSEYSFATNPAPVVSNVKASNVSIYSAYITFTVKNGIKSTIKYGKTVSYGGTESISTSKSESTYTVALTNLLEGTQYHLQIDAEDEEANIFSSDDYTFETLPVPKIANLRIQQVADMPTATLRLVWESNALISSIVTYYPSGNPAAAQDQISLALKKKHEMIIKNMRDDTDYSIVVRGKDSAGNEAVMPARTVKTAIDLRPPEISNMNIESTITGVGEEARAQIIISWDTDEPASTQIEYGQGTGTAYGQTTQEDTSLTLNHTVTIPGLSPAKIYHLRAVSKDKSGNAIQSADNVIITPKSTKDALNLVIDNLSKTFGFLRGIDIQK